METKRIVKVEETEINIEVAEELFEMWTGRELEDRIVRVGFWQTQVADLIEDLKDDGEFVGDDMHYNNITALVDVVNKLDSDLLIEFNG